MLTWTFGIILPIPRNHVWSGNTTAWKCINKGGGLLIANIKCLGVLRKYLTFISEFELNVISKNKFGKENKIGPTI